MSRGRRTLLISALLVGAYGVHAALFARRTDFLAETWRHAEALGYERDDVQLIAHGSSNRVVSWEAYLRFRPNETDHEVRITIQKPSPFEDWRLSSLETSR